MPVLKCHLTATLLAPGGATLLSRCSRQGVPPYCRLARARGCHNTATMLAPGGATLLPRARARGCHITATMHAPGGATILHFLAPGGAPPADAAARPSQRCRSGSGAAHTLQQQQQRRSTCCSSRHRANRRVATGRRVEMRLSRPLPDGQFRDQMCGTGACSRMRLVCKRLGGYLKR